MWRNLEVSTSYGSFYIPLEHGFPTTYAPLDSSPLKGDLEAILGELLSHAIEFLPRPVALISFIN